MPFVRRHLIQFAAASLATLALGAAAQSYPTKPVTLMVPYSAGGLSDNIARRVNVPLAATLGQPAIIENLGGASGSIAAQKVVNAPSDGYMVFQGSPNELILAPLAILLNVLLTWLLFREWRYTLIALVLMELDVFQALGKVLGLYANVAISWMMAVTIISSCCSGRSQRGPAAWRICSSTEVSSAGLGRNT